MAMSRAAPCAGRVNSQSRPIGEVGFAEDDVWESRRSKLVP